MGLHLAGDRSPAVLLKVQSHPGPVLFNILINDLDGGVECTVSKFAGDAELGSAVDSLEGQEALQRDLDRLEHWAMINDMECNKSRCWILHLDRVMPGTSTNWERSGRRAALQKGTWRILHLAYLFARYCLV